MGHLPRSLRKSVTLSLSYPSISIDTANEKGGHAPMPNTTPANEFEQHRTALFGLAYRMIGSVADAENIVQEVYLRWQSAPATGIESVKAYLMKITSRLCIDHLRLAHIQREHYVGSWLPEPLMQEDSNTPEQTVETYEAISTAFLVLLESLAPIDRAVFLLHEVFSYTYAEIAAMLGRNPADCRQIGYRARQKLVAKRPRFEVPTPELERVVQQFLHTCNEGNITALMELLAPDVTVTVDTGGKVNAAQNISASAEKAAHLYINVFQKQAVSVVFRMVVINGQPALLACDGNQPVGVTHFDINNGKIQAIYQMRNPDKLQHLTGYCNNTPHTPTN